MKNTSHIHPGSFFFGPAVLIAVGPQLANLEERPFVGAFRLREKDRLQLERHFVTEWRTVEANQQH